MSHRQEVNLYLPELRKQFDPLSLNMALVANVAVVALLFFIGVLGWWQNSRTENQISVLTEQKNQLEQTVIKLRKTAPKSQAKTLLKEIALLEEKADARRVIRRIISGQNLGNAQGFSSHFYAFSRQIGSDLALHSFQLSHGGAHVEIQGFTREAVAVPRFVELLQGEENFQRVTFGQLRIARPSEVVSGKELRFSLGRPFGEDAEGANL